jgi:uncharacterized protein
VSIDWNNFTPIASLAGGALIGIAALLLVLLNGRVAGISGILGGLLPPKTGDASWRMAFLAGLVVAPTLWALFIPLPEITVSANYGLLVIAGVLVGVSTRFGAGCTSGHGVCGISRFSLRSVVATLAFMFTGFLTVFLVRHVLVGA